MIFETYLTYKGLKKVLPWLKTAYVSYHIYGDAMDIINRVETAGDFTVTSLSNNGDCVKYGVQMKYYYGFEYEKGQKERISVLNKRVSELLDTEIERRIREKKELNNRLRNLYGLREEARKEGVFSDDLKENIDQAINVTNISGVNKDILNDLYSKNRTTEILKEENFNYDNDIFYDPELTEADLVHKKNQDYLKLNKNVNEKNIQGQENKDINDNVKHR